MAILSLNSHVAHGYVGNAAAVFALQRQGLEVWPVQTVHLSNHPGYGACRGRVSAADELDALVAGLAERGALATCRGVLSGYLGRADQGPALLRAVERARAARPACAYTLDPVMGDTAPGLYVARDIAAFFQQEAVPRADVVTPNAFELGMLVGDTVATVASAVAAARDVLARGPRLVVVTSLELDAARIGVLAVTKDAAWQVAVPRLRFPIAPNGAGDLLAALLAGASARGRDTPTALGQAVNAVHAVLRATQAADRRELDLIGAQAALADPPATLSVADV
jgi:pyridoxine kinase